MLYKPSTLKLIIGSRRTGITGELVVPGAPHEPARSCSPTPSTRPHDPNRIYKPPSHQQKRSKESFLQASSAPMSSQNSTDAKTSTNAAVSAAPQAKQTTTFGINTVPRLPPYTLPTECGGRSAEGLGRFASHLTHATTAKTTFTNAAVTAAPSQMAGQPKLVTSLHATRTDESIKRNTIPPSTTTGAVKSRAPPTANLEAAADTHTADDFAGTRAKVPGDGACLFHAVSKPLKPGDTANHTVQQTIITNSASSRAFWAKNTVVKTPAANSADRQAARQPQNDRLARVSDQQTREQQKPIKEGLQILQSAPESSKNSPSTTISKTYAAAAKASLQAAEPPTATPTPTRTARTIEVPENRTTSPTTIINDDTKSRANLFEGTRKSVDADGDCFYHALATRMNINQKQVRAQIADWLKANPNFPFTTCTLSAYVEYETNEEWSAYCARMTREHTWAGMPELVAATQIWRRTVRVFKDVGDRLFDLAAVLGEEGFCTPPIDLVFSEARSHYDVLIEVRPRQTISPKTIAQGRTAESETIFDERNERKPEPVELDPVATLVLELEALSPKKLEEAKARRKLAERQVLDELAARKESKNLEERKARERHKMRKELAECKAFEELAQRKTLEELTERTTLERTARKELKHNAMTTPKELETPATAEACCKPDNPALDARKKPKYQHESRKARAAREVREELQRYRMHRAREDLAATKVREHEELRQREDRKARQTCKARENRIARETPKERAAREARELSKALDACARERKARTRDAKERSTRRMATGREPATNLTTAPTANLSLPYLPIPPCSTTPMPALHLYDVELEYSRSAMTSALECMVPTTNAALVLAYRRHYVHVATDRLRALDTSRPPLTSNRASTTRAIIQPPTVALPMTPAELRKFLPTHRRPNFPSLQMRGYLELIP